MSNSVDISSLIKNRPKLPVTLTPIPGDLGITTSVQDTFSAAQEPINKISESPFIVPTGTEKGNKIVRETVPSGYQGNRFTTTNPGAYFASLPQSFGGGQYLRDPNQSDALLKSDRLFVDSSTAKYLRGGLPGRFAQVDHIVPLWLGGSDTPSNLQALNNEDHDNKTKIQAVIMALYNNKELSLDAARNAAITWRDKNVYDIDIPMDPNTGTVGINEAKKIWETWQKPKKVTIKDWWNALKAGDSGIAYNFGRGFSTGVTGGWIPPAEKELTPGEEIASGIGQTLGGVALLISMSTGIGEALGLFGLGGRAAAAASTAVGAGATASRMGSMSNILRGAIGRIGGKAAVEGATADAVTATIRPNITSLISKGLNKIGLSKTAKQLGNITVSNATKQRLSGALYDAGLVGLVGQLSRQEQNDVGSRAKRLFFDALTGGAFGIVNRSAGQNLSGYGKVFGGTFALSYIGGEDPKDALINSLTFTALHGLGRVGYDAKKAEQVIDQAATQASFDLLNKYTGYKPTVEELAPSAKARPLEQTKADRLFADAYKGVERQEANKSISKAEATRARQELTVAYRHLSKQNMGIEQRMIEDAKDMSSLAQRSQKENFDATPTNKLVDSARLAQSYDTPMYRYMVNNPTEFLPAETTTPAAQAAASRAAIAPETTGQARIVPVSNGPTGDVPVTGIAETISPEVAANIRRIAQQSPNGDGISVWIEYRPDLTPNIKKLRGEAYVGADNTLRVLMKGPQDVIPTYVGYVAGPKRAAEINAKMSGFNLSQYPENLWRDNLAAKMKEGKIEVLPAKVTYLKGESPISGQPGMRITIDQNSWNRAAETNSKMRWQSYQDTQRVISDFLKVQKDAGMTTTDIINNLSVQDVPPVVQTSRNYFTDLLNIFQKNIAGGTPETLIADVKQNLGEVYTLEEAKQIFEHPEIFTVEKFTADLQKAKDTNKLNDAGLVYYNQVYRALLTDGPLNTALAAGLSKEPIISPVTIEELPLNVQDFAQKIKQSAPSASTNEIVATIANKPKTSSVIIEDTTPVDQAIKGAKIIAQKTQTQQSMDLKSKLQETSGNPSNKKILSEIGEPKNTDPACVKALRQNIKKYPTGDIERGIFSTDLKSAKDLFERNIRTNSQQQLGGLTHVGIKTKDGFIDNRSELKVPSDAKFFPESVIKAPRTADFKGKTPVETTNREGGATQVLPTPQISTVPAKIASQEPSAVKVRQLTQEERATISAKQNIITRGTKKSVADKLYRDTYEEIKSNIDNMPMPSQASGNLTFSGYVERIKSIVQESKDAFVKSVNNKNIQRDPALRLTAKEQEKIFTTIIDDLTPVIRDSMDSAFHPENTSEFSKISLEDVARQRDNAINNIRQAVLGVKGKIELEPRTTKPGTTDFEQGTWEPSGGVPAITSVSLKALKGDLEAAMQKTEKGSPQYALNETLLNGLKKAFGEGFEENAFVEKALSRVLQPMGGREKQAKDLWANLYQKMVQFGGGWIPKAEYKGIFKKRLDEMEKSQEAPQATSQDEFVKTLEGMVREGGLSIRQPGYEPEAFYQDVSPLEQLFGSILLPETTPKKIAIDAKKFVLKVLSEYNKESKYKKFIPPDWWTKQIAQFEDIKTGD